MAEEMGAGHVNIPWSQRNCINKLNDRWMIVHGKSCEKDLKNNNKARIKLSETILSILGDCWEKCISSSLPARLMVEFTASKVHLQPTTWFTGNFPSIHVSKRYWLVWVCWVWSKLENQSFSGDWGGGRGEIHPFTCVCWGGGEMFQTNST